MIPQRELPGILDTIGEEMNFESRWQLDKGEFFSNLISSHKLACESREEDEKYRPGKFHERHHGSFNQSKKP